MNQVLRLSDYRPKPKVERGPQYICTRCNAKEFYLHSCGTVKCADCGATITNLLVGMK